MDKDNKVFETLNNINVNDKTESKGNLTYLSWAWAWAEVKKAYPDATYDIERFGEDRRPYLEDANLGYMVFTSVTIQHQTHIMWLPVMDFRNQALKVGKATMFDINKTIMRCLTKNLAMHGLGLYIYAGEDLPEDEKEESYDKKQFEQVKQQRVEQAQQQLDAMSETITKEQADQLWMNALTAQRKDKNNAMACIKDITKQLGVDSARNIKAEDFDKANQMISDWMPFDV